MYIDEFRCQETRKGPRKGGKKGFQGEQGGGQQTTCDMKVKWGTLRWMDLGVEEGGRYRRKDVGREKSTTLKTERKLNKN